MILQRYMAWQYARVSVMVWLSMVSLVVLLHLVESIDVLSVRAGGTWIAVKLALLSAVEYSHTMLPPACFLALLITGAWLGNRGEILAMQSMGFTSRRLCVSWACVVCLCWGAGLVLAEHVVPRALRSVERMYRKEGLRSRTRLGPAWTQRPQWVRSGRYVLFLPEADVKKGQFFDPTVYVLRNGVVHETLEADVLVYENKQWVLFNVFQHPITSQNPPVHKDMQVLPITLAVADMIDVAGNPRHMSYEALDIFLHRRRSTGFDAVPFLLEKHERWSYASSVWGLFALAWPWVCTPSRRRSVAVTMGGGAAVVAVFFAITQVGRLLVLNHVLPGWLGAWLPLVVCVACVYPSRRMCARVF
jgi:lipopolysaccharide export LptBFGC system permease protein LptF